MVLTEHLQGKKKNSEALRGYTTWACYTPRPASQKVLSR
jgi:hypothetical protein